MIKLAHHNEELKERIFSASNDFVEKAIDLDIFDMVLRECLTISEMRELGSFFTGQELATKAVSLFENSINNHSIILDPACGAGNLLIECSRHLNVNKSLKVTLQEWGGVLYGYDINGSFIEAAKLRLIVEAVSRGANRDCSFHHAMNLLSNIIVKDALTTTVEEIHCVTHIIMNPPFISIESPKVNYWKLGKVNMAGIFVDHFIRISMRNTEFSAILPDVLRSGSRYDGFRGFINQSLAGSNFIWGRFNKKTDVDVFMLHGITSQNSPSSDVFASTQTSSKTISSYFDVCIGPLVAYRDPLTGPDFPYFHAKNSKAWDKLECSSERRKFSGKVIKPPFVIVKRTSSPNDKYRAVGTIINCEEAVAVENHMIVIQPKNKSLKDCQKLIEVLRSDKTNEFLNERIRLRHLTVSAIKEIPMK